MAIRTIVNPCVIVGNLEAERPAKPSNNVFYFSLETNQLSFYNGVEWSERDTIAIRSADLSFSGNIGPIEDPQLRLLFVRNAKYALTSQIIYSATAGSPMFVRWDLFPPGPGSAPVLASLDWTTNAFGPGQPPSGQSAANNIGPICTANVGLGAQFTCDGVGAGTASPFKVTASMRGILSVGAVPGFLGLAWGPSGGTTRVFRNSWISLKRIA